MPSMPCAASKGRQPRVYFGSFSHLVRVDDPAFEFGGRSRRPPLDRMNALLSFLYAVLGTIAVRALEAHGLDPQVGFLTRGPTWSRQLGSGLDGGVASCVGRSPRVTVSSTVGKSWRATSLSKKLAACGLTDDARKQVLIAWQERKRDELRHPFLGEATPLGLVAHDAGTTPRTAPSRRPRRLPGLHLEVSVAAC